MTDAPPAFTAAAVRAGARGSLPLLPGLAPFGLVCGIAGQQAGLSLVEVSLMSALVYAGSAQLVALGAWAHPAPVLPAILASLVVNLRYALMGPVLGPWLGRVRGWRLWLSLFLMADQNWALSVAEMNRGRGDAGYLLGSGLAMWVVWVATTAAGHWVAGHVSLPPGHPVFFAALAVFVAMLVSMWRGARDVVPWAVAGATAALVARLLPGGNWHIVAGALAGSLAGGLRDARRDPP